MARTILPRQQIAFKKLIENISHTYLTGEKPKTLKLILKESGYAPSTITKPGVVIQRPSFQELLAQIDDDLILTRVFQILADSDKRTSLSAAEMLLKLKDRFPANKLKVQEFEDEMAKVYEDPKPEPRDAEIEEPMEIEKDVENNQN